MTTRSLSVSLSHAILEAELDCWQGNTVQGSNFLVLTDWRYGYVGFQLRTLSHLIIATTNFSSRLRTILPLFPLPYFESVAETEQKYNPWDLERTCNLNSNIIAQLRAYFLAQYPSYSSEQKVYKEQATAQSCGVRYTPIRNLILRQTVFKSKKDV